MTELEKRGLRVFNPLPADHYAVRNKVSCGLCNEALVEGDVTTLIPKHDPYPEQRTVEAVICHARCVEKSIAAKAKQTATCSGSVLPKD